LAARAECCLLVESSKQQKINRTVPGTPYALRDSRDPGLPDRRVESQRNIFKVRLSPLKYSGVSRDKNRLFERFVCTWVRQIRVPWFRSLVKITADGTRSGFSVKV